MHLAYDQNKTAAYNFVHLIDVLRPDTFSPPLAFSKLVALEIPRKFQ